MIHFPSLPSGFVVYCDDIRQEVGGKITLVGAYADEMTIFEVAPVVLPQLRALVVCRFPPNSPPNGARVKVIYTRKGEEDVTLLDADLGVDYDNDEPIEEPLTDETSNGPDTFSFGELRTLISLNGIRILGPGFVRTRIMIGEDEVRLGALEVKLQPTSESPTFGDASLN